MSLKKIARQRLDSWMSAISGLGGTKDKIESVRVKNLIPLHPEECHDLFFGNGLAASIVSTIVESSIGTGLTSADPELDAKAREIGLWPAFAQAWTWGRLYGRGALYFAFSDRLGRQSDPIAPGMIRLGDLAYIRAVDGLDLIPSGYDEARGSLTYGEPIRYTIGGAHEIHASRLILFGGAVASDRYKRAHKRDYSVLQRPFDSLRGEGMSNSAVLTALGDLSQTVFAVKNLTSMIASGQGDIMQSRMEIVDMGRSVAKAVVIDADAERFEHVGAANLSGIDPLLGRLMQRVATAAGMPATVLLKTAPIGMNATGDSDLRIWYSTVNCERTLRTGQAERALDILARSCGKEARGLKWPNLWQPSEDEQADIDQKHANTDAVRIASGVLDASEVALIRWGGVTPEEIVSGRAQIADDAEGAEDAETVRPLPGETWIDTSDQNRLQVTMVANGRVYFVDLDSENPGQQMAWKEATFVERTMKMRVAPAL